MQFGEPPPHTGALPDGQPQSLQQQGVSQAVHSSPASHTPLPQTGAGGGAGVGVLVGALVGSAVAGVARGA